MVAGAGPGLVGWSLTGSPVGRSSGHGETRGLPRRRLVARRGRALVGSGRGPGRRSRCWSSRVIGVRTAVPSCGVGPAARWSGVG